MQDRAFDLVVFGATGFTGQIVAEYLQRRHGIPGGLRWALAGRSLAKLEAVRDVLGLAKDFPLLKADSEDPGSIEAMVQRTRLCLSTAGPYQLYGSVLVAACAKAGVDYVDLSGETPWMRTMIDAHSAAAAGSGARILFSCGFDSIPSELGVFALQTLAETSTGAALKDVTCRVLKLQGGLSGGTLASMKAGMAAAAADSKVAAQQRDPFVLTPGFRGPTQPEVVRPQLDPELDTWVAPFFMAPINTRNVHRSNFLQNFRYSRDFTYQEIMVAGPGPQGETNATMLTGMLSGLVESGGPEPGEGPSRAEREAGSYELLFTGVASNGVKLQCIVTGDQDPGYGSTAKIISETAILLLNDARDLPGGIWTPGAALGTRLTERLEANAGVTVRAKAA